MAIKFEKFDHVCRELLHFNEDDLKAIKKHKWQTLMKLKNAMDLGSFSNIPRDGNYDALVGIYCYMKVADKKINDIY